MLYIYFTRLSPNYTILFSYSTNYNNQFITILFLNLLYVLHYLVDFVF